MKNLTETDAKYFELLKAKSEGKIVETLTNNNTWINTSNIYVITMTPIDELRIKPKPQYTHFSNEDYSLFMFKNVIS